MALGVRQEVSFNQFSVKLVPMHHVTQLPAVGLVQMQIPLYDPTGAFRASPSEPGRSSGTEDQVPSRLIQDVPAITCSPDLWALGQAACRTS